MAIGRGVQYDDASRGEKRRNLKKRDGNGAISIYDNTSTIGGYT